LKNCGKSLQTTLYETAKVIELIRKVEHGLDVYVLYDELGSSDLPDPWIAGFRGAKIRRIPFNTRQGPQNRFQLNFRNHRNSADHTSD
jgi:phosphatidylserine/phosphatidylglycerophosphate/cardiolipin synthase-like enzyme